MQLQKVKLAGAISSSEILDAPRASNIDHHNLQHPMLLSCTIKPPRIGAQRSKTGAQRLKLARKT